MIQKNDFATFHREIITFFGNGPSVGENPHRNFAELCITTGNFLCWIAPLLQADKNPPFPGLPSQSKDVKKIGEKFRQIGLEFFDRKVSAPSIPDELYALKIEIEKMRELLGGEK